MADDGVAVVSEMSWFGTERPQMVLDYWGEAYPQMASETTNTQSAERHRFEVLFTERLPAPSWWNYYYDPLLAKADALLEGAPEKLREAIVGGTSTQALLETLTRGGRYASAGAIGGPLAEIDLRTLYLNDLTYFGCTFQTDEVFENLILYIEAGEINMPEPRIFPLEGIAQAQKDFMDKVHIGKFVLVP